jgi:hypothetical protein
LSALDVRAREGEGERVCGSRGPTEGPAQVKALEEVALSSALYIRGRKMAGRRAHPQARRDRRRNPAQELKWNALLVLKRI